MPFSDFQREVAAVALKVAAAHGFVLGGGNALILHGIVDRYTADVDLVTDQPAGVEAAAAAVEEALRAAGLQAERQDRDSSLGEVFTDSTPGWPSGSSPAPAASRQSCRSPTSTATGHRYPWTSVLSLTPWTRSHPKSGLSRPGQKNGMPSTWPQPLSTTPLTS